ncbi:MAG TPA: polymer-forming cytoskeletal protein, partial [Labilithrix sp.]|nr:polymer-forming cytoskeletal protein [Labilithrix sp.]
MATTSTVIGRTTFVRGRVSGDGDLEIAGRVEGDVAASGEVVIEASALVAANVSGSRIVVRGAVKGDLVAEEALVIEAGARVVGDLRAPRIAIAQGGLVRGHVQTGKAGAARPRAAAAPARAVATETKSRPAVQPAARPAVKVVPAPSAPVVVAKTNHKPVRAAAAPSRPAGPPPPVVPVLKKGTKAVQK